MKSQWQHRLVVSPTTIKFHINHPFAKVGLRDRAQAVNYAYRHGIATPPHEGFRGRRHR